MEAKINDIETRVKKLEDKPKDKWEKLQVIGAFLIPIAIAATGFFITRGQKSIENKVTVSQTKISQAELIASLIEPLSSGEFEKQKIALSAIRIGLERNQIDELYKALYFGDISEDLRGWLSPLITTEGDLYSYPSPYEYDVFDEWVIQLTYTDSKDEANSLIEKFIKDYNKAGQTLWENDILLVRSPIEKGIWLIVIDTFPGRSSKEMVIEEIRKLKALSKLRDYQNLLGRWFEKAESLDYKKEHFIRTYGEIKSRYSGAGGF